MSAIPTSNRVSGRRTTKTNSAPITDVTRYVKSWGRRGILFGALFGFAFGAILVAIPLSTDILTFGAFGTLMIAAVECAIIAGGFAALAAALSSDGGASNAHRVPSGIAEGGAEDDGLLDREVPLADCPDLSTYPMRTASPPVLQGAGEDWSTASSLQNIQTELNTIDAWENGNTGP